ncbi:HipA domain-containing protein [Sphingobium sp. MI1205]|uniref:HipA domain-containing protein n=1 Tax=Sphingobium sp. MI1205 TaxID=407020 RepID=UPI002FF5AE66
MEWLCLELGRAAGFATPNIVLTPMPDGMSPALIVERFDIRHGADDQRRLALEDFCSVLDLPALAKYQGIIERIARGLRPLSTDPAADLDTLFRRAMFAWLIADGDMHRKNLALLKIAAPDAKPSRRFALRRFMRLRRESFPDLAATGWGSSSTARMIDWHAETSWRSRAPLACLRAMPIGPFSN